MNELVTHNRDLITTERDVAVVFQEPLRFLTPISRTVKQCRKDLAGGGNSTGSG